MVIKLKPRIVIPLIILIYSLGALKSWISYKLDSNPTPTLQSDHKIWQNGGHHKVYGWPEGLKRTKDHPSDMGHHKVHGSPEGLKRTQDHPSDMTGRGRSPRILVFVMTTKYNMNSAKAVYQTWGSLCDKIIFFGKDVSGDIPAIDLGTPEGKNNLNQKLMAAFSFIYKNHFNDFDWFMKADDDTYVIVENLKHFLSDKDPSKAVYYGQRFRTEEGVYFYSGGAGYVVSKEALRRLATDGQQPDVCVQTGGAEDWNLGQCCKNLGIEIPSGNDDDGKSLFHAFNMINHIAEDRFQGWYKSYAIDNQGQGPDSIGEYPITFHRVKDDDPRVMHYLLCNVHVKNLH